MESIGVLYQCWWLRPREHSGSECLSYFEFCAKLRVQLQLCAGRNSSRMALVAPSTMSSKTTQGILYMFPSSSRSLLFWFMMEIHGNSIELLIVWYLILASASIVFMFLFIFQTLSLHHQILELHALDHPPPTFFFGNPSQVVPAHNVPWPVRWWGVPSRPSVATIDKLETKPSCRRLPNI